MKKVILAIVVVASIAGVANAGPLDDFKNWVVSSIVQLSDNDLTLNDKIENLRAGDITINSDRVDGVTSDLVGGAIIQTNERITELEALVIELTDRLNNL